VKIAFIGLKGLPTTWTGIEFHIDRLGRCLIAAGHEVAAYVRPYYTDAGLKEHAGIRLIRLPTIRSKHLDASLHSLLASVDALFRGFDVIHYHCIGPGFFSFIPRVFGMKVVCTVHRLDWQAEKWGPVARWLLRLGEWVTVRAAHRLIVVSEDLQEYFRKTYRRESTYIPNGIDPVQRRRPREITERWGLVGGDYGLFVGRLSPEKKVDWLIKAFRSLDRPSCDGKPLKLVIAGGYNATEPHVEELRKLAAGDRRIIFTGFVTGSLKEELFSNAAVFVLPSSIEGMPIVLLEAKSYGACCLVSDIAPHRSLVRDGVDGRLFAASELDDLTAKLRELLDDGESREQFSRTNLEHVVTRVSWDAVVNRTAAVYRELSLSKPQ
jgi:glycosyltransferase involved in cell wall biosynthesis